MIKSLLSNIGSAGAMAILAIILPALLAMFKPQKAYKALRPIVVGWGTLMSKVLNTRLSKAVGNVIEKYLIKVIVYVPVFLFLDFIVAFRKDNKDAATTNSTALNIKQLLKSLII